MFHGGMREVGGGCRVRALATRVYHMVCRNKLLYGRKWVNNFSLGYRNLTIGVLGAGQHWDGLSSLGLSLCFRVSRGSNVVRQ